MSTYMTSGTTRGRSGLSRRVLVAAALVGLLQGGPATGAGPAPAAPKPALDTVHYYRVAARIRPLVFWIGRDNVGSAQLGWGQGPDGTRTYELLIGSDPDRTPRRVNRWGYLSETIGATSAEVVGLMTESDEATVEEAKAQVTGGANARRAFKTIRATVTEGQACSAVVTLLFPEPPTYRALHEVLARLAGAPDHRRCTRVPAGTGSGFLSAMDGLLQEHLAAFRESGRPQAGATRGFVYGRGLYNVSVRSSRVVPELRVGGFVHRQVLDTEFELRSRTGQGASRFRVMCGTQGSHAGVPLRVLYRPRWWFEAELVLDGGA